MPQYMSAFVPGGTLFFTLTLLERLEKIMMLTKGGRRYVFPPYVLRAVILNGAKRSEESLFLVRFTQNDTLLQKSFL